ncbi:uncharacterized protein I206_106376 [Kwoniella pini CBS 10737]|uniref:Uncharacterized protein n=1 Tax=Kwoniella pini CBS 10737 TaxID=1296096 RepID=A0A1B9HU46_9TREE|nr:uncharacterized protein I206_07179 [Kwoniella pini CBS 10737]OCF46792.1 hypothetical protein I206_07179 [Kwoniella pini CBS 10737]
MSMSPDGRKRPRASDVEERDVKRLRNEDSHQVDGNNSVTDDPQSNEILLDKMGKMEKLYKEILIQSALIFQHQSFSKRLGLKQQMVPTHMMHRLETTWRSYEGVRKQIEWFTAQSGKNLPSSSQASGSRPSSTLASIMRLASNVTPPKPLDLPTPVNLYIAGQYTPLESPAPPEKDEVVEVITQEPPAEVISQVPPSGQARTDNQESLHQPLDNTSSAQPAQAIQTGLVEPPPPVENPMQLQNQILVENDLSSAMNYSTLGLDELEALVNGNAFENVSSTLDMTMGGNSQNPALNNVNVNVATNQSQQTSNEILASLGLETGTTQLQPPQSTINVDQSQQQTQQSNPQPQQQDQSADFEFSQALSNGTAGLANDMDFSALAGLFSNEQPPSTIPQPSTSAGQTLDNGSKADKIDGLDDTLSAGNGPTSKNNEIAVAKPGAISDSGQIIDTASKQNQSQNQLQESTANQDNDMTSLLSFEPASQPLSLPQTTPITAPVQPVLSNAVQTAVDSQSVPPPENTQQSESSHTDQSQQQNVQLTQPGFDNIASQPFPDFGAFQPDLQVQSRGQNQTGDLQIGQDQNNEFGQIDMSDFNFTDAGIENMGMGGDEFERLMAEFE